MSESTETLDDILEDAISNSTSDEDRKVMNPITGTLIDLDSIDDVIRGCEDCKSLQSDLSTFYDMLRRRAVEFTTGTAKTRRIQGQELRAKIEMPDETWDQPVLKALWTDERFKEFKDRYLKLGSVNVIKAEFNKVKNLAAEDETFRAFQAQLLAAEKPPTGAPRVTLEK